MRTLISLILLCASLRAGGDVVVVVGRPAAGGGGGYSAAVLADTPVVYYRLNEGSAGNAADSSGNGHTGTYGAGITYSVSGATTDSDTAVTLPGGATGVDSVDAPVQPGASPFTWEIWMKKNGNPVSFPQILIGKYAVTGVGDDAWLGVNTSGKAVFSCKGTSVVGGTTVTDNTWRHIVGVKDGTDLKIYVNGSSDATPVAFSSTVSPGGDLHVGQYGAQTGFYFIGSVDECAIYLSAIDSTRISAHYAAR